MASIARDPGGRKRIIFRGADKKRKAIRLGKCSERNALAVKVRVEDLVSAAITGHPPADETARWVAALPDEIADKLAVAGLIPERQRSGLGAFL